MMCPFCSHAETKVIDKRDSGLQTKRRRECLKCEKRFNSIESVEKSNLRVIKKDGSRQEYDPEKMKKGVMHACEKRPVSTDQIEMLIVNVEEKLRKKGKEVSSTLIGELISKELKKLDKVAYIRFASVYRDFTDVNDFKKAIKEIVKK
jgi:transcriptional repressor NrdR